MKYDTYQEIFDQYDRDYKALNEYRSRLEAQKERVDAKIEKLKARSEKLEKRWYDARAKFGNFYTAMERLAQALGRRTGLHAELLGPFGVPSNYGIWLYDKKERDKCERRNRERHEMDLSYIQLSISIDAVYYNNVRHLEYHTGKTVNRYPKGSIGDLNGENNVSAPLPKDIDEIIKIMKQLKSKEV